MQRKMEIRRKMDNAKMQSKAKPLPLKPGTKPTMSKLPLPAGTKPKMKNY